MQAADFLFSQIHEHLLRTHFRMEPVCVSLYRHLSQLHPIHEILKYHCRGLFPLNANGTIVLLTPGKYAHALFSVGHYGAFTLLQRGYEKMVWNDFGIENVQASSGKHLILCKIYHNDTTSFTQNTIEIKKCRRFIFIFRRTKNHVDGIVFNITYYIISIISY